MLIIGLTGSMGMGKSTAAERFRAHGIPVFDADAAVHCLYGGPAAPLIEAAFPGSTRDGKVDRTRLSEILARDPAGFARLEALIHPLVESEERAFLQDAARRGAPMAVLEIPLLFETGADARVDVVVVVTAPEAVQRRRLMERPGMTAEKLDVLLARQMPDAEKCARADFVVDSSGTIAESHARIDRIIASLQGRDGEAFARYWSTSAPPRERS